MKKHLLLVIVFLFTSVGYGRGFKVQTSTAVYQPMMENSKPSTNHLSTGMSNERIYVDHAKDTSSISPNSKPKPKPKPKRYTLVKVVFYLLLATYCSYWLSINQ